MKNLLRVLMLLTVCSLPACMGTDEASEESAAEELLAESSQALPINACSLVRCRAGTRCEIQHGRPVCVPEPKLECASDKECRTFSNYCEGCQCLALSIYETNPVCKGQMVACFVDPCRGAEAQCVKGRCVLGGGVTF